MKWYVESLTARSIGGLYTRTIDLSLVACRVLSWSPIMPSHYNFIIAIDDNNAILKD